MPRPQSTIWQYFSIVDGPDGKGRKASCSFCGHQQACGVTRLHQHLLRKCSRIPPALRTGLQQQEEAKEGVKGNRTQPPATKSNNTKKQASGTCFQQTMDIDRALSTLATQGMSHLTSTLRFDSATSPISPSQQQQQQQQQTSHHPRTTTTIAPAVTTNQQDQSMLDWYLARALFSANVPFTVVDNPHFASFLKRMRPGYTVPRPYKLRQHILKEQHWDLIEMPALEPDKTITRPCSPTTAASASSAASAATTLMPSSSSSSISNPSTTTPINCLANTIPSSNDASASASTTSQTSSSRLPMRVPPELDGSL